MCRWQFAVEVGSLHVLVYEGNGGASLEEPVSWVGFPNFQQQCCHHFGRSSSVFLGHLQARNVEEEPEFLRILRWGRSQSRCRYEVQGFAQVGLSAGYHTVVLAFEDRMLGCIQGVLSACWAGVPLFHSVGEFCGDRTECVGAGAEVVSHQVCQGHLRVVCLL